MQDWIRYQFALGNYMEVAMSSFRPNAPIAFCTVLKKITCWRKSLIKTVAGNAGLLCKLSHSLCASYVAEGGYNHRCIPSSSAALR